MSIKSIHCREKLGFQVGGGCFFENRKCFYLANSSDAIKAPAVSNVDVNKNSVNWGGLGKGTLDTLGWIGQNAIVRPIRAGLRKIFVDNNSVVLEAPNPKLTVVDNAIRRDLGIQLNRMAEQEWLMFPIPYLSDSQIDAFKNAFGVREQQEFNSRHPLEQARHFVCTKNIVTADALKNVMNISYDEASLLIKELDNESGSIFATETRDFHGTEVVVSRKILSQKKSEYLSSRPKRKEYLDENFSHADKVEYINRLNRYLRRYFSSSKNGIQVVVPQSFNGISIDKLKELFQNIEKNASKWQQHGMYKIYLEMPVEKTRNRNFLGSKFLPPYNVKSFDEGLNVLLQEVSDLDTQFRNLNNKTSKNEMSGSTAADDDAEVQPSNRFSGLQNTKLADIDCGPNYENLKVEGEIGENLKVEGEIGENLKVEGEIDENPSRKDASKNNIVRKKFQNLPGEKADYLKNIHMERVNAFEHDMSRLFDDSKTKLLSLEFNHTNAIFTFNDGNILNVAVTSDGYEAVYYKKDDTPARFYVGELYQGQVAFSNTSLTQDQFTDDKARNAFLSTGYKSFTLEDIANFFQNTPKV